MSAQLLMAFRCRVRAAALLLLSASFFEAFFFSRFVFFSLLPVVPSDVAAIETPIFVTFLRQQTQGFSKNNCCFLSQFVKIKESE